MGWNFSVEMARHHDVTVLTTHEFYKENQAALSVLGGVRICVEYYDLPFGLSRLNKAGLGMQIYYYLWQVFGARKVARLHAERKFDIAQHVTFIRTWSPSLLRNLAIPFIWGPVGGAEKTPRGFSKDYHTADRVKEGVKELILRLTLIDPLVRRTAKRCRIGLATTSDSLKDLRTRGVKDVRLMGESALSEGELAVFEKFEPKDGAVIRFVCMGRLLHWKGFQLAIRGFAEAGLLNSELWICGEGSYRKVLQELAATLGVKDHVVFWGMLKRDECLKKMKECHALVHPSFHDSGGWVCLEAMASGHPVICLDHGGPGYQITEETGFKLPAENYGQTVVKIAQAMRRLATDQQLRQRMGKAGRKRVEEHFLWSKKADFFSEVYQQLIAR